MAKADIRNKTGHIMRGCGPKIPYKAKVWLFGQMVDHIQDHGRLEILMVLVVLLGLMEGVTGAISRKGINMVRKPITFKTELESTRAHGKKE